MIPLKAMVAVIVLSMPSASVALPGDGGPAVELPGGPELTLESLRDAIRQHRGQLSGLSVEYTARSSLQCGTGSPDTLRVRWSEKGFIIETIRGAERRAVWFDAASGKAASVLTSGGLQAPTASVGSPADLELTTLLPEYCGLLGFWPTRAMSGGSVLQNDVMRSLTDGDAVLVPGFAAVRGHRCVIVERRVQVDGNKPQVTFRAAIAPSLGFAVVSTELFSATGRPLAMYAVDTFAPAGDGALALPLEGVFRRFDRDGGVAEERKIVVVSREGERCLGRNVGPADGDFTLPNGCIETHRAPAPKN